MQLFLRQERLFDSIDDKVAARIEAALVLALRLVSMTVHGTHHYGKTTQQRLAKDTPPLVRVAVVDVVHEIDKD